MDKYCNEVHSWNLDEFYYAFEWDMKNIIYHLMLVDALTEIVCEIILAILL